MTLLLKESSRCVRVSATQESQIFILVDYFFIIPATLVLCSAAEGSQAILSPGVGAAAA